MRRGALLLPLIFLLASCGGDAPEALQSSSLSAPRYLATSAVTTTVKQFVGLRDRYIIVRTASGFDIKDRSGVNAKVSVTNVSALKFDDASVNLGIGDLSKTISAADLQSIIELYIAFFNRIPDADGMAYWIGLREGGQTIDQIAASFYAVAIAPSFTTLTGYSATMSAADFITTIYKNVLGRSTVDAEGLAYWTAALDKNPAARATLVSTILSAAHSYKGKADFGYVADLLDNKNTVGSYFAIQQGLTFAGDAAAVYSRSAAISTAVKSDSTTDALALFALTDSSFDLRLSMVVPSFATIQSIVVERCVLCHSNSINGGGIALESAEQIRARARLIYANAGISDYMPQGNSTDMTTEERRQIVLWFEGGTP